VTRHVTTRAVPGTAITEQVRVDLIYAACSTDWSPDRRDSYAYDTPAADGFWFRVCTTGWGILVGMTRDLPGLAALGIDTADPGLTLAVLGHPFIDLPAVAALGIPLDSPVLAGAVLDDPRVAAALGIDPAAA
jgi:hypothetical protein